MDILLNSLGDIDVTNNEIILVTENDAIAQHLSIRLKTFLGEWFLNTNIGMPYFEEFLVKSPNKLVLDSRIREAVLETPGIVSVDSIEYSLDPVTRALSIAFTATLDSGTSFNFTFSEFIIGD
jgi:hypothetical protein